MEQMNGTSGNPSVFISYAHEGNLSELVGHLAVWLTQQGIRTITDHPFTNRPPEQGWRVWMQHNIEDADVTLVVCSQRYKQLFEKREVADDGGLGVTWESAIITNDLYHTRLKNKRYFPIIPDGGQRYHVPALLQDWDNNHRFPSGNERILALVRDEVTIPTPDQSFSTLYPGELSGSNDARLLPREGEIIGRSEEVDQVLSFLNGSNASAMVSSHVTGSAGVGKTEVCKAALRRWLHDGHASRAFYVQVSDAADTNRLLIQLGEAVGLAPEVVAQTKNLAQLQAHLPNALYYLDNLESLAESSDGIALLRALSRVPNLRLLASSRVALDGVLGESITIGRLDSDSACELFLKAWNGAEKPSVAAVSTFVHEELGGHALSITLLARLGRAYSWETLIKKWQYQGTQLAQTRKPTDRLDSLDISFAITRDLLAEEAGALDLWVFAALFADGIEEELLELWGQVSGFPQARVALADHHLLIRDESTKRFILLPPVARYALEQALGVDETAGFCWVSARDFAYASFIKLSHLAARTASDADAIEARTKSARNLNPIGELIATDSRSMAPSLGKVRQLHEQLFNTYMFNALAGRTALLSIRQLLMDGLSAKILGDLESRLGNLEPARGHYDEAIVLYQKEQAKLGLANTLKALGDLERRLGNLEPARGHYDEAIVLYQKEQNQLGLANVYQSVGDAILEANDPAKALPVYLNALALYQSERAPLGQAYVLAEIIRCRGRLENLAECELVKTANIALKQAAASGVESVTEYVLNALYEACGKDSDKLKKLIQELEMSND